MKILEIKNLNLDFKFDEDYYRALFNINLDLYKGETLAIVGESGSGKTITMMSVLNLLAKNAKIVSGEIIYNGENLLKLKDSQMQKIRGKKIALIPQDPMTSLNPLFTIESQMVEVIQLHQKVSKKEAKKIAIEALRQVQIPEPEKRIKSYPHEFSGGMKQRVIIAIALSCNADIIIADEPTTALDVTVQAQIMKLLNEIKQKNNTSIILITHDLGLVAQNSDRVAVMYAGKVVELAETKELFHNPKHPYTEALLKSIPSLKTAEKLQTIQGQPPHIKENIKGCKFNPRCKYAFEECLKKSPQNKEIAPNHFINCFK